MDVGPELLFIFIYQPFSKEAVYIAPPLLFILAISLVLWPTQAEQSFGAKSSWSTFSTLNNDLSRWEFKGYPKSPFGQHKSLLWQKRVCLKHFYATLRGNPPVHRCALASPCWCRPQERVSLDWLRLARSGIWKEQGVGRKDAFLDTGRVGISGGMKVGSGGRARIQ